MFITPYIVLGGRFKDEVIWNPVLQILTIK